MRHYEAKMIDETKLLEINDRVRKALDVIWDHIGHSGPALDAFGDIEEMVGYINENAGKETK